MKLIAISQRLEKSNYGENRAQLDTRLFDFVIKSGLMPIPIPYFNGNKTTRYCFKEAYGLSATIYHVNKGEVLESGEVIDKKYSYEHRYLSVSQDLLEEFPFGAIVYIVGAGKFDGYWKVNDTMKNNNVRRIHFLVNNDVTVGLWDDIAMYCVETPDLYNK